MWFDRAGELEGIGIEYLDSERRTLHRTEIFVDEKYLYIS
jgi:hypothetical protein